MMPCPCPDDALPLPLPPPCKQLDKGFKYVPPAKDKPYHVVFLAPDSTPGANRNPKADAFIIYKHKSLDDESVVVAETRVHPWDNQDGHDRVMLVDADGLEALQAKGIIQVRYWKAANPLFDGQPYKPPLDLRLSPL
jgi:hypothetical protein